jgi:hypothetical protein
VEPQWVGVIVEEGRERPTVNDHVVRDAAPRRWRHVVRGVNGHQLRALRGDNNVCGQLLRGRACREAEANARGADEAQWRRQCARTHRAAHNGEGRLCRLILIFVKKKTRNTGIWFEEKLGCEGITEKRKGAIKG